MIEIDYFDYEMKKNAILYIYTPMCGTCKLAEQMMKLCQISKPYEFYYKLNINKQVFIAEKYQVESVPCLLIIKEGQLVEKIYAFESVTNIFNKVTKYFQ